jgi:hypothetical protein
LRRASPTTRQPYFPQRSFDSSYPSPEEAPLMTAVLFIADLIFGNVLFGKLGARQSAVGALKILNIVTKEEEELVVDASAFLFADDCELAHKVLAHSDLNFTFFFHNYYLI